MLKKYCNNGRLLMGAIFILLTLAGTFLAVYSNPDFILNKHIETGKVESRMQLGELHKGGEIQQTFLCSKDRLLGFDLFFGTFSRQNAGNIMVTLNNRTKDATIESWKVDCNSLGDNAFTRFTLSEVLHGVKDDQLEIIVTSDTGKPGNAVTLFKFEDDSVFQEARLYQNGTALKGTLLFSVDYRVDTLNWNNVSGMMTYIMLIAAAAFLAVCGIYRFFSSAKAVEAVRNIEKNRKKIIWLIITAAFLVCISIAGEAFCSRIIEGKENSLGTFFHVFRWLFIFTFEIMLYLLFLYYRKVIKSVEILFFALVLSIGGLFACTLPVTGDVSWDDKVHYSNALQMSNLADYVYNQADIDVINVKYPRTFNMKQAQENIEKLNASYNDKGVLSSNKEYKLFYNHIGYLPAALAIGMGRMMNLPFQYLFLFGKLGNLIVYAAVCCYGMKKLKGGKILFAVIAMLPANIYLAANYSYDFWVTGFIMMGTAYLISELQQPDKKLEKKDFLIMLGGFVIGMGPKAIYFCMVFLCMQLGRTKFKTERRFRQYRTAVICASICVALSFLFPLIFSAGANINDIRGGAGVDSAGQIKFIITNPVQYTKILLSFLGNSYLNIVNAPRLIGNMGYLGVGKFSVLAIILMAVAACADRNSCDTGVLTHPFRLSVLGSAFITVCLIATALYVSYNPVASEGIGGCQPRYLLPLVFVVAYCLGSGKIKFVINKRLINSLLLAASGSLLLYEYWSVYISRYV